MLSNSVHQICLRAPGCLRWNSAVSSGTETSEVDSQELCSRLYPFHLMRYWNLLQCQRLSSISSTSHFASPSMTIGSGWSSVLCPVIRLSGARVSFTMLNTGWSCFIRYGSFRRQAIGLILRSTTKGLSPQCKSFCEEYIVRISNVSRKTLSSGLNTRAGVLHQSQYLFMSSCALQITDFASLITILILSVNSLTISRSEWFCWGSKPIQGIRPVLSRNGGCWVAEQM